MSKTILRAFDAIKRSGTVNESPALGKKGCREYFWRGFSSPNGDILGRAFYLPIVAARYEPFSVSPNL
jgi:hypothetical protein